VRLGVWPPCWRRQPVVSSCSSSPGAWFCADCGRERRRRHGGSDGNTGNSRGGASLTLDVVATRRALSEAMRNRVFVSFVLVFGLMASAQLAFGVAGPFLYQPDLSFSPAPYGLVALFVGMANLAGELARGALAVRISPRLLAMSALAVFAMGTVVLLVSDALIGVSAWAITLGAWPGPRGLWSAVSADVRPGAGAVPAQPRPDRRHGKRGLPSDRQRGNGSRRCTTAALPGTVGLVVRGMRRHRSGFARLGTLGAPYLDDGTRRVAMSTDTPAPATRAAQILLTPSATA
jgi:hypothetical protein